MDLELEELGNFYGTENYYSMGALFRNINVTDGVKYIMDNGYSWFVTDALSVIVTRIDFLESEFLTVRLRVDLDKSTAKMTIEDGNNNVLYEQDYAYTNAKVKELVLFYSNGVLMLNSEW